MSYLPTKKERFMKEFNLSFNVQSIGNDFCKRANQMIVCGLQTMNNLGTQSNKRIFSKEEYCCGSTLHRGCYQPSPVYDLIVGNAKRGKLCRSTNPRVTHHFLFDDHQRLVLVETFHRGRISSTEYLFYENQTVIGITIDCNGFLASVSEERYEHGKISYYAIARCYYLESEYKCFDYHQEEFVYDELGLSKCRFINFTPQSVYLIDEVYDFQRENGYLVAYSPETFDGCPSTSPQYLIKGRRKA